MKKVKVLVAAAAVTVLSVMRPLGIYPIATTTLVAAVCGYLAAYWYLLARAPLPQVEFDKLSANQLVGSWKYDGPGIAFTSENALAKASGQVGATQIEEKLKSQYAKLGFNSSNTTISFTEDGKFKAKILGRSWEGSWTYDASNSKITMKGLILSVNGYVTRNGLSGISLVFEAKKLLTLLQVAASMSGNTAIETVGEISKSYDGLRVGFDLSK